MSGNDAPGRYEAGPGPSRDDDCVLQLETVLASPDPAAVTALSIGDVLEVTLEESPPSVIVVDAGRYVGGVTQRVADLRRCIQRGVTYAATVGSINHGAVRVSITNS